MYSIKWYQDNIVAKSLGPKLTINQLKKLIILKMNKLLLKDVKWLNQIAKFHLNLAIAPVIKWKTEITGKTPKGKNKKEFCIDEVEHLNINFYRKRAKKCADKKKK